MLITWSQQSTDYSNSVVGTVSGTAISFGTLVTMDSNAGQFPRVTYDANAQKCVVVTRRTSGTQAVAGVGTISGTSVSYGTLVTFAGTSSADQNITYDSTAEKIVVSCTDNTTSYLQAIVGTVSGTDISFGTLTTVASVSTGKTDIIYDSGANRLILTSRDNSLTNYSFTAYIGTLSGTTTTWGGATVYASVVAYGFAHSTYDVNANKTLFFTMYLLLL